MLKSPTFSRNSYLFWVYTTGNKQPETTQAKTSPNQLSPEKIIAEDKRRDARNVERRKIIKRQTLKKRNSLVDSLLIAKAIIDGHATNKQFEKRASERRRVIKNCCLGSVPDQNKRRMSFADELVTACSVVTPKWDHKQSVEKSKEKCRAIKDQFASGKRRPSLLKEISVARKVIVDSEREKRMLPPEIVEEMIRAHRAPAGPIQYYNEVLNKLLRESHQSSDNDDGDNRESHQSSDNDDGDNREMEVLASDNDIDELTSGLSGLLIIDDNEEPETMIENELLWRGGAGIF